MTLKPCPFCGSKNVDSEIVGTAQDYVTRYYAVVCRLCGSRGPDRLASITACEEDWNKRDKRNAE